MTNTTDPKHMTDTELDQHLLATDKAHGDAVLELRSRFLNVKGASAAHLEAEHQPVPPDVPNVPATPKPDGPAAGPPPNFESLRSEVLTPDMGRVAVAKLVSTAKPGTTFLVRGDIGPLHIGGADRPEWAASWVDRPLDKVMFYGETPDAMIGGLTIRNDHGGVGDVRFQELAIRPKQNGDFAAVRGWKHQVHEDSMVSFNGVHLTAPEDWTAYGGFGMKWAMHVGGLRYAMIDVTCDAAQEHSLYDVNGLGAWVQNLENYTRVMMDTNGNVWEVGNGRTLAQWQERRTDGPPRQGDITILNPIARHCSHEGLLGVSSKPQGGSCLTIGGNSNGRVLISNPEFIKPYCGQIAVWAEANAEGLRGYADPATLELELRGVHIQERGNRRAVLISSVGQLRIDEVTCARDDFQLNHQSGVKLIEPHQVMGHVEWL